MNKSRTKVLAVLLVLACMISLAPKTALAAPLVWPGEISNATALAGNQIKVEWDTSVGASHYTLYRSTAADGVYTKVKSTAYLSYTDTGLADATTYYYKMQPYVKIDGVITHGDFSGVVSATTIPAPSVAQGEILSVSAVAGTGIKVTWNAAAGATHYTLYRSESEIGPYSKVLSTYRLLFIDRELSPGTTYYYKVQPYIKVGGTIFYGAFSPVMSAATMADPLVGAGNITAAAGVNFDTVSLTWDPADGAGSYDVYRSDSELGPYTLLGNTYRTYYVDTALSANTTHYYKIQPYKKVEGVKFFGAMSGPVSATTPGAPYPQKPGWILAGPITDSAVRVAWGAVEGATRYEVRRTNPDASTTVIENIFKTLYVDTGLDANTLYTYQVTPLSTGKGYWFRGEISAEVSTTTLAAPVAVGVGVISEVSKPDSTSRTITWETAANATHYTLYRSTSPTGAFTKVLSTYKLSYQDTGLDADTQYFYKVQPYRKEYTVFTYGDFSASKGETLDEYKAGALDTLEAAFATYYENLYTAGNWTILEGYKNDAFTAINNAANADEVDAAASEAIAGMDSVSRRWAMYTTDLDPVYTHDGGTSIVEDSKYLLPEVYTGNVTMEFDLTADQQLAEVIIGFVDKDIAHWVGTNYTRLSIIVSLYNNDKIRVRNGGVWFDTDWSYTAGVTYHFRIVADMNARTYAVYVTPEGGEELTLGTAFGFRTAVAGDPVVDDVGMLIVAAQINGYLENLVITDDTPSSADALSLAKTIATTRLAVEYASYDEADYSAAEWVVLTTYKTDGDQEINDAATLKEVTLAKDFALSGMSGVDTLADIELAGDKVAAKADIAAAYSTYVQEFFTAANWTTLTAIKNDGNTAVDAAATLAEVNTAKETALNGMAGVATILPTYSAAADDPLINKTKAHLSALADSEMYLLPEVYTGYTITITFDFTPLTTDTATSAQIGFLPKSQIALLDNNVNRFAIPIAVVQSNFRARNGGGWLVGPAVVQNTTYEVTIVADMVSHTYDVSVDGVQFGDNLLFRTGVTEVVNASDLAAFVVLGDLVNQLKIENVVVSD